MRFPRASSCESRRKCEHLGAINARDNLKTACSSNCATSLDSSRKSSQSQMAVIEITEDQSDSIPIETPPSHETPDPAEHPTETTSTGRVQHKELESILKVPSDRLLSPKKSNSQFMSLLLTGSSFKHRGEASSLRNSQKEKGKKHVSIAAHHSG